MLLFTLSFTPPLPVPCNTVPSREPRPLSLLCVFSPYGLWSSRPTSSPPNWLAFCFASFLLLYTVFVGTVERQRTKRVEWCTTGLWSRTSLSVAWELRRERMPQQLADRRIHAGISRKLLPGPCGRFGPAISFFNRWTVDAQCTLARSSSPIDLSDGRARAGPESKCSRRRR